MSRKPSPIIPSDDAPIFDRLTTLDKSAIVRPNNPPEGIAGFLFDYDADEVIELSSQITDNPIEDNSMVADAITLLPEKITLRGLVSELTAVIPTPSATAPAAPPAALPLIPGLFPPFSVDASLNFRTKLGSLSIGGTATAGLGGVSLAGGISGVVGPFSADAIVRTVNSQINGVLSVGADVQKALNNTVNTAVRQITGGRSPAAGAVAGAINQALGSILGSALTPAISSLISQSVNSSVSTTSAAGPGPTATAADSLFGYYLNRAPAQAGQTRQSIAFGYFYQLWLSRELCSVETPWGTMTNCAIERVSFEQPEQTKDQSEISIIFKKVRFASNPTVSLGQLSGRAVMQAYTPAQNGVSGQTPATPAQEESWLRQLVGPITATP